MHKNHSIRQTVIVVVVRTKAKIKRIALIIISREKREKIPESNDVKDAFPFLPKKFGFFFSFGAMRQQHATICILCYLYCCCSCWYFFSSSSWHSHSVFALSFISLLATVQIHTIKMSFDLYDARAARFILTKWNALLSNVIYCH